ncbi:MAG: hypothetical protein RLZZ226_328 [Pseudomonadota bacterium]
MGEMRPRFQSIQYGFAAYIRDPARQPLPTGIAPTRMQMYQQLFFSNMENFLASGFPVLKAVLEPSYWHQLVRDFFAEHHNKTPLFVGIAGEFLDYLSLERPGQPGDPAFLLELAHYEWVELALEVSGEELAPVNHALVDDPLPHRVRLSALAWPLVYRFPVHRIAPTYRPHEPPDTPTCLLVYRDREDRVRFLEISAATYRLLERLDADDDDTLAVQLRRIATELAVAPDAILQFGADRVRDWAVRGIVA